MKQSNIPVIVISVIACILLLAVLSGGIFLVAYHIKNPEQSAQETHTDASSTTQTPTQDNTSALPPTETTETPSEPAPTTTPVETPTVQDDIIKGSFVLAQTSDAGDAYQDALYFLGDSTTYHMIANEVLKNGKDTTQVWFGFNGTLSMPYATTNLLYDRPGQSAAEGKLLSEMLEMHKPDILVITLGVGVSHTLEEDDFKYAYSAVIDCILNSSPKTKIICQSIYPVCRIGSALEGGINNSDIRRANKWIADCVKERNDNGSNVFYLDSYFVLSDAEGYLPVGYSNGDGLHLNADGYRVILDNLRTHKVPD